MQNCFVVVVISGTDNVDCSVSKGWRLHRVNLNKNMFVLNMMHFQCNGFRSGSVPHFQCCPGDVKMPFAASSVCHSSCHSYFLSSVISLWIRCYIFVIPGVFPTSFDVIFFVIQLSFSWNRGWRIRISPTGTNNDFQAFPQRKWLLRDRGQSFELFLAPSPNVHKFQILLSLFLSVTVRVSPHICLHFISLLFLD